MSRGKQIKESSHLLYFSCHLVFKFLKFVSNICRGCVGVVGIKQASFIELCFMTGALPLILYQHYKF